MTTATRLLGLFGTVDGRLGVSRPPRHPGPVPRWTDSAVVTFALAQALRGSDSERRVRRARLRD